MSVRSPISITTSPKGAGAISSIRLTHFTRVLGGNLTTESTVKVAVDVTNTGKVAGDEVAQLYLRDVHASVTTPVKQLVRFERVTLEPGETKTIAFELTSADLSVWNDRMERVVEPGKFVLMAGGNSRDVKTVEFELSKP